MTVRIHQGYSFKLAGGVMSHVWLSHVTSMNQSCHMYEKVMSHVWMSHVTRTDESRHTDSRAGNQNPTTSVIRAHRSHVPHRNNSCHTYRWVTHMNESRQRDSHCGNQNTTTSVIRAHRSHFLIWMSHVTRMNESRHTDSRTGNQTATKSVLRAYKSHVPHVNESCHTYKSVTSHTHTYTPTHHEGDE